MARSRTFKFKCSICGYENAIQVEIPEPKFGGRNPQVQAGNRPPQPQVYRTKCANCGQTNQVSLT